VRSLSLYAESFLDCVPHAAVGKILIQRDEATAQPVLFYSKIPALAGKRIVLVDPMLATGGSAKCALKVLVDAGADESKITFITVLSCPEGLNAIASSYPGDYADLFLLHKLFLLYFA
jgi:uracil phosphoribosyltransferase